MRSLVLDAPGQVSWYEAPEPDLLEPTDALVRPLAVALCDLDGPIVQGRTPFPPPIHLGHEAVARVEAAGPAVERFAVGDVVCVPFQISCGTCDRCARGLTGSCRSTRGTSMYGFGAAGGAWGGMLSDLARVPWADHMLVRVPDGVDPVSVASVADNVPDGWRTVAPALRARPGADVLVLGGGAPSVGLYAVAAARALGAGTIDYLDTDPHRLAIASDLRANPVEGEVPERAERTYPITVDAGSSRSSVACALRSTSEAGTCTSVGIVFGDAEVPLLDMYLRGVTFHIGRAHARASMEDVLALVGTGDLRPELVTDSVRPWEEAPDVVVEEGHTKVVLAR
ncbi:zinc-binding dehydrogenase [Conexibacter sp. SYSU D00693]|uniref:zinc-dependent alcohol dehydrogenase n=1 Tax=Conexibacter sp. SYSU D00693 TaxID=2812560 RepID=UPI00196B2ABE|nr:alcohol dehydrogenase catalytic domain-containing protein [Conexibacter sp. SYSU D00693]